MRGSLPNLSPHPSDANALNEGLSPRGLSENGAIIRILKAAAPAPGEPAPRLPLGVVAGPRGRSCRQRVYAALPLLVPSLTYDSQSLAILVLETSLPATRARPSSLLCLIIFPQQPNQFGHARPVSPVVCSGVIRWIELIGRSAALSRLRQQVSQLHFLLRPQIRRKSESDLASDLDVISPFSYRLLPM